MDKITCRKALISVSIHSLVTQLLNYNIGATAADRSDTTGESDASARGTRATTAGEGGRKTENLQ